MKLFKRKTDEEYVENIRTLLRFKRWRILVHIAVAAVFLSVAGCYLYFLGGIVSDLDQAYSSPFTLGVVIGMGSGLLASAAIWLVVATVHDVVAGSRTCELLIKYHDAAK